MRLGSALSAMVVGHCQLGLCAVLGASLGIISGLLRLHLVLRALSAETWTAALGYGGHATPCDDWSSPSPVQTEKCATLAVILSD